MKDEETQEISQVAELVDSGQIVSGRNDLGSLLSSELLKVYRFVQLKLIFADDGRYALIILFSKSTPNHDEMLELLQGMDIFSREELENSERFLHGVNFTVISQSEGNAIVGTDIKYAGSTSSKRLMAQDRKNQEWKTFLEQNGFTGQDGNWGYTF